MKTNSITRRIFSSVLALLVITAAVSVEAAQGTAKVIRLSGAARYSNGNNVWLPLSVGTVLRPGAVIQTASESSADLLLSDEDSIRTTPVINKPGSGAGAGAKSLKNVVRLRENTLLAIEKLSSEKTGADVVTDTQLDLRAGTIFGNVKKTSAASRYEVKIPNGVAGIRGTTYSVSASGIITVYSGSVVVTFFNPSNPSETITKVVNAGQSYDLNTDVFHPAPSGAKEEGQRQAHEMSQTQTFTTSTEYVADYSRVFISPVTGNN